MAAARRCAPLAAARAAPARPPVDLVFCAYNEAGSIAGKLANCLAIAERYPNVRIHAYSDGSSDGTAEALHRHAHRIRAVISQERTGKSVGMNTLLAGCDGEIVLFTDANVTLSPAGFASLYRYFDDPSVGCVCGHLIYVNGQGSSTAATSSLYWRLEEKVKALESATGSVMGADGSVFAIRRRLFREVPADIIDDFFTSMSILCDGYRIVRAPELLAYERSAEAGHEEFRRKVRIACRAFNCHRLLWPRLKHLSFLDRYKYLSHKLVRWLAILWLALALASGVIGLAALGLGGPALIAASLGGLGLALGPARALVDLLAAFLATGLGIWRSLRGERFRTWETAATAR